MNVLDVAITCSLSPKFIASTKGGEYASGCPMCGGNDRFRLWPKQGNYGKWWCRGCGKSGDAVSLLIEAKQMTFKEACAYLGKELKARRRGGPVAPKEQSPDFIPREARAPVELWRSRALAFVSRALRELLENKEQLGWLSRRGITEQTVRRFNLGWNSKDIWQEKSKWEVEDNGKKLWLPRGLVIPYFAEQTVRRLRIRRTEGEPRYCVVPGSGMEPMAISQSPLPHKGRAAWVVVESELDAILIAQDAGDVAGVMALGSVAAKPDAAVYATLKDSAMILIALDFDKAGAKALAWWNKHFPQSDRWPVPKGKDPGDYREEGGDIRAWILAGLPYGLRPPPAAEVSAPEVAVRSGPANEDEELLAKEVPDPLNGFIFSERFCRCGKKLEVYLHAGTLKEKIACAECMMKKGKNEKK